MEVPKSGASDLPADYKQVTEGMLPCEYCHEMMKMLYGASHATEHHIIAIDEWIRHIKSRKCRRNNKSTTHAGNGAPTGAFAFTLTKAPTCPLGVSDMLAAVRKVMAQRTKPVVKYAWYYEDKGTDELGEPIHPHIHGMYETEDGGRIPTRQWERAWEPWKEGKKSLGAGFPGGYHRPVRSEEGYSKYIKKDGGLSESLGMD